MDEFPRLVIDRIMRFLPISSLLALATTCKKCYKITQNPLLWKFLVKRDFGEIELLILDGESWVNVYRNEHEAAMVLHDAKLSYHDLRENNNFDGEFLPQDYGDAEIAVVLQGILRRNNNLQLCMDVMGNATYIGLANVIKEIIDNPRFHVDERALIDHFETAAYFGYSKIVRMLLTLVISEPEFDLSDVCKIAADEGHGGSVLALLEHPSVDPTVNDFEYARDLIKSGDVESGAIILNKYK